MTSFITSYIPSYSSGASTFTGMFPSWITGGNSDISNVEQEMI